MAAPTTISLVVTDLDGTLWDRHGRVHDLTLQALKELERRGLPVLAATARRPASARKVMQANGLLLPAVLLDGSIGKDLATGETFHRQAFTPDQAAVILDLLRAHGVDPCVTIDDDARDVVVSDTPSTHPNHLRFLQPWIRPGRPEDAVRELPVLSFLACGCERELLAPAQQAVLPYSACTISADREYGGYTFSVRPLGVSKWQGVLAFCAARGLDPTRVLAVGDGENDVELLQSAAVACAISDGCDAVLQLAHHHFAPAHEGGWHTILRLL